MKVLENWDVASLYPNLVRIYGYSSRNQSDKQAYIDLLHMRIKAKHNELSDDFLKPLGLTNGDLKSGLKLPLNAYTGCLRAPFNPLYDNLQGFSICSTGQMLLLQLAHDLKEVPTVEITELNTDAVQYMVDEEYVEDAHKKLQDWQDLSGLELEQDKIVKLIQRDVNNYVEILQVGDDEYDVHYKGGLFTGNHSFTWNKDEHKFEYEFSDDLKSNSLTICAEAILKNLLFNIPVEDTVQNCNDPFRFQMITHLGGTYDKCILEHKDGTQEELQRNNRVYAGAEKNGNKIYKIKGDRKDSLANCPPNPIVDNDNHVSIEMINKTWYIKYAKQKISDFIGKKEIYMDDKLEKLKKDELIAMIKETSQSRGEESTAPMNAGSKTLLMKKIDAFRKAVRARNFILDKELPRQLGGGEIYSIDQVYHAIQDIATSIGLDFSFEVLDLLRFDLAAFKPATGAPQNIATIRCAITLTDIETGCEKVYTMISQGSDSIDKAVNSASSYALRNWFNKTFTPAVINGEKIDFGAGNTFSVDAETNEEIVSTPTTPKFVSPEKKEQIVEEITTTEQKDATNDDFDEVTDLIYELRELTGNKDAGKKTMDAMLAGTITDIDLMNAKLKLQNAIADVKKGN